MRILFAGFILYATGCSYTKINVESRVTMYTPAPTIVECKVNIERSLEKRDSGKAKQGVL